MLFKGCCGCGNVHCEFFCQDCFGCEECCLCDSDFMWVEPK